MKIAKRYWLVQIIGWVLWTLLNMYLLFMFKSEYFTDPAYRFYTFREFALSLLLLIAVSHIMKLFIQRNHWIRLSFSKLLLLFLGTVVVATVIYMSADFAMEKIFPATLSKLKKQDNFLKAQALEHSLGVAGTSYYLPAKKNELANTAYQNTFNTIKKDTHWYRNQNGQWRYDEVLYLKYINLGVVTFVLFLMWLALYMLYNYIQNQQQERLNNLRLANVVKSLELRTLQSHINPHFIFNTLNSIRSLVEENPQQARTAITKLSNILRNSLQADGAKTTVPLAKEIEVVQDYLAIEKIRFEERLSISIQIEPDVQQALVPFMMLQTLVENAIKHGISNYIEGGNIQIQAQKVNDNLVLQIFNTGNIDLNALHASNGFGIKGTRNRLELLYAAQQQFLIHQLENNIVHVKIIIPFTLKSNES